MNKIDVLVFVRVWTQTWSADPLTAALTSDTSVRSDILVVFLQGCPSVGYFGAGEQL